MKKIILVIAAAVIAGAAFWFFKSRTAPRTPTETPVEMPAETLKNQQSQESIERERGCVDSGGTVTTASCCQSADDFPDSCAIGACGCAPQYSHPVKFCGCGGGKCFKGNKCVEMRGQ